MSREHDIELFVLKNAVITQSLRAVLAMHRVGNARGALETQADSLVTEYLRQIDYDVLADADRMSEFYKLFYALANDMRDLITSVRSAECRVGKESGRMVVLWW